MHRNVKKMWPALAASLVAVTSGLSADDAQMRNLENRVSALEQRKNANGIINPNGRPACEDGAGLYIEGEALWMRFREDGLDYVIKNHATGSTVSDGDLVEPHFNWGWGFRVGVGFNMDHDGWDLDLDWTRFHHTTRHTVNQNSGQRLFPVWVDPQINGVSTGGFSPAAVSSRLNLRLDQVNFELGREFFTSKWLTLRPHAGLTTAWLKQKYSVNNQNVTVTSTLGDLRQKFTNNFWGIGLRGGMDTQWGLGGGWSIFGNLALSLFSGYNNVKGSEFFDNAATGARTNRMHVERKPKNLRALTDLELGLRWDHTFCDDRFHLGIQAGWEQHIYFSQNQTIRFVDDVTQGAYVVNEGDVTLEGLAFGLRFDF